MKDKNPVDNCKFFENWDDTQAFSIPRHKVSYMVPERFAERYLRVFLKDPTPAKIV
jgi:hypothetical protein